MNYFTRPLLAGAWVIGQLSLLTISPQVLAEGAVAAPQDDGLAEIVVTAERRSSDLQKTALSLTALSADNLAKMGTVNALGLSQQVPGVEVASAGGFQQIHIRGVGGGVVNAYGEPGVGYNIAGVYIAQAYAGNAAYYDINRIEVLKGPQGTLYGRNSTAGAINIIPNQPDLSGMSAAATLQVGNYSDFETQAMLNLPLSDTVGGRLAISTVKHNGYFTNGKSDADSKSGRLQLLFKPNDKWSVLLHGDFFKEQGQGTGDTPLNPGAPVGVFGPILPGVTTRFINPSNPWQSISPTVVYPTGLFGSTLPVIPLQGPSSIDHKQTIVSADLEADLGFATLSVIPAYVSTKVNDHLYNYGYTSAVDISARQFTGEVRLASDNSSRLKWLAGLYYFDQSNDSSQTFFQEFLGFITLDTPHLTDKSYAPFGQVTFSVTDRLRLTAGLRYTKEKKSVDGNTITPGIPAFLCPAGQYLPATGQGVGVTDRCAVPNSGDLDFNSTNYKAGLEFDVSDNSLLYANVSTGFKAGGFNPGSPPNTFPPEKLTAYEIGSKNRLADGKVTLNGSAFYWNYVNEANPGLGPINPIGFAFIVVPGRSHIYGAEGELAWKFSRNDLLSLSALYEHAEYVDYSTLAIPLLGIVSHDYSGSVRPYSPKWSGNADYEHTFRLPNSANLVFNANAHFQSSQLNNLAFPLPDGFTTSGYGIVNASLTFLSSGDRFTVGAYVNNATDRFIMQYGLQSPTSGNTFVAALPPRTYGIRASVKF